MRLNFTAFRLVCFLFCSTALSNTNEDFFVGSWYTKVIYDNKLYGCEVFSRIDLDKDKKLVWRAFGILNEGDKRLATVLLKAPGTYSIDSGILKCTLFTPDGNKDFTIRKESDFALAFDDGSTPANIYFDEMHSKETRLLPIQEPNTAEQDAAANP